jgi:anhydro-N-acetylmuramic acid kinase
MSVIKAIGIMSGTSLDGVDLACCEFEQTGETWNFKIIAAETFAYSAEWKQRLATASGQTGLELASTNNFLGRYFGEMAREFIRKHNFAPDFIASHGHTIFHLPNKGLTLQIGSGAEIAAQTGLTTVCDFRTSDVALGGQGAPLVPVGDKLLFSEFQFCLNLGGFANISFDESGQRIAFDICPLNTVLNFLANKINLDFDKDGLVASGGNVNTTLLTALNEIPFYSAKPPKSLGREWLETSFLPVLNSFDLDIPDKMRTVAEHFALQIAAVAKDQPSGKMLITGGGAFNRFLVERISYHSAHQIVIPDPLIVNFKEALIFAFLGVLRLKGIPNCLSSVTGASHDNVGGVVYFGGK